MLKPKHYAETETSNPEKYEALGQLGQDEPASRRRWSHCLAPLRYKTGSCLPEYIIGTPQKGKPLIEEVVRGVRLGASTEPHNLHPKL